MVVSKYIAVSSIDPPAFAPTYNHLRNEAEVDGPLECDLAEETARLENIPSQIQRAGSPEPSKILPNLKSSAYEPVRLVKWGVHWLVQAKMISLFIAGIALGVGHHCYYLSLAGTEVISPAQTGSLWDTDRQEWKIRFGTAFAFLAKTCLATAIAIAYTQHIWASCKRKAYSISGLDALFSATSDVFAFTSLELTLRAKVGALLAALVWMLPLSALITPATLTVVSIRDNDTRPGQVPHIDFPVNPVPDIVFRVPPVYETVDNVPPIYKNVDNVPSALLIRTSFATASSMSILPMSPGTPNSTYTMNFDGPSLKCEEPNPKLLGAIDEIVTAVGRMALPTVTGISVYTAFTPVMHNFSSPASFAEACILGGSDCSFVPGNVTTSYFSNETRILGRSDPLVINLGKIYYTCALMNTSYSVRFRSLVEQTTLELISYEWKDTNSSFDVNYATIGMAVAKILTGTYYTATASFRGNGVSRPAEKNYMGSARTSIGATALIGLVYDARDQLLDYPSSPSPDFDLARNKTLGELVEELSRNVTLSLFSSTRLMSNTSYLTNITYESQINVYAYNTHNLWTAYGVAIFVTLFGIGIGFHALYSNGISYRASFSTFVATTRNHVLDEVMIGSSLGAAPMRGDVLQTQLKFGVFDEDRREFIKDATKGTEYQRAGFGLETQIGPLKKRQCCY